MDFFIRSMLFEFGGDQITWSGVWNSFFGKQMKYLKLKTRKKAGLFPGTFIFIS